MFPIKKDNPNSDFQIGVIQKKHTKFFNTL